MDDLLDPTPGSGAHADPDPTRSLRDRVGSGLKWSLGQQMAARAASFGSGVALAHILVPEDFGVFAVALTVTNVLFGLNDLGLLLAVVRWEGDVRIAVRTAMTLAVVMSIGLFALCFVATPWYADVMESPESTGILRLLLVTIVLDGIGTVHQALLIRDFRQARLAQAEFAAMPVGIGLTIGLALTGAGAWSFAIGQVAANAVTLSFMVLWSPMRPWPGFDRAVARRLLTFGVPLAGASLVEYCLLNADYVVVGRALGPVALGFYLLAFNLSSWPSSIVTEAIRKVSFVSFHELSADVQRLADGFRRTFVVLVTFTLPLILGLSILALPLVEVVYGNRWRPAAQVLRFLAVLGGTRVLIAFVFDLLVGVGESRRTLRLKIAWCIVLLPALEVGVRTDGLRGVAIAHAIVAAGIALPLFMRAAARMGIDLGAVARDLRRPVAGAIVAGTVLVVTISVVRGAVLRLALGGLALGATYTAFVGPRLLGMRRVEVAGAATVDGEGA